MLGDADVLCCHLDLGSELLLLLYVHWEQLWSQIGDKLDHIEAHDWLHLIVEVVHIAWHGE